MLSAFNVYCQDIRFILYDLELKEVIKFARRLLGESKRLANLAVSNDYNLALARTDFTTLNLAFTAS